MLETLKNLENWTDESLQEMVFDLEDECTDLESELNWTQMQLNSVYTEIDRRKEA